MEELEKQIAEKMAQIAAIQEDLKVLRAQKKAIMDEVPRCRNCKNCMVVVNERGYKCDWKCSVTITKHGRNKIVAKSWPACEKYERGPLITTKR